MPCLRGVLLHSNKDMVEIRFELCKALQTIIYYGQQLWLAINPHPDTHLHQDPKDLAFFYMLRILGCPQLSVLRYLWKVRSD